MTSLTPERIEELKRLAEKATPFDPDIFVDRYFCGPWSQLNLDKDQDDYVRAFQPTTILSLLSALEERTKALRIVLGHMTRGEIRALHTDRDTLSARLAEADQRIADARHECGHEREKYLAWRDRAERLEKRLAEAMQTYTDERGTVWTVPTAEAYARACGALHKHRAAREQAEQRLADVERREKAFYAVICMVVGGLIRDIDPVTYLNCYLAGDTEIEAEVHEYMAKKAALSPQQQQERT